MFSRYRVKDYRTTVSKMFTWNESLIHSGEWDTNLENKLSPDKWKSQVTASVIYALFGWQFCSRNITLIEDKWEAFENWTFCRELLYVPTFAVLFNVMSSRNIFRPRLMNTMHSICCQRNILSSCLLDSIECVCLLLYIEVRSAVLNHFNAQDGKLEEQDWH